MQHTQSPKVGGTHYFELHILGATAGGEKEPATTHAQNPKGPIPRLDLHKVPTTAALLLSCFLTGPALEGSEEVASQEEGHTSPRARS